MAFVHILNLVDLHQSDFDDQRLGVLSKESDLPLNKFDNLLLKEEVVFNARHLHEIKHVRKDFLEALSHLGLFSNRAKPSCEVDDDLDELCHFLNIPLRLGSIKGSCESRHSSLSNLNIVILNLLSQQTHQIVKI